MTSLILFSAQYLFVVPVVLFAGYWFFAENRRRFLLVALVALPVSYCLGLLVGHFFYDPRPFTLLPVQPLFPHAADNGFPSDHALLTGTLAAIISVFSARLGFLLWVLAFIIGGARVLAYVHHAIDIAGSFLIAIVSVMLAQAVVRRIEKRRNPELP